MKLKKELEKEVRELERKLNRIKEIPCGHFLHYCPNCGNPVLLNKGQEFRKFFKKTSFTCSAGHSFSFSTN